MLLCKETLECHLAGERCRTRGRGAIAVLMIAIGVILGTVVTMLLPALTLLRCRAAITSIVVTAAVGVLILVVTLIGVAVIVVAMVVVRS